MKITQKIAIDKANRKAKELNYEINNMEMILDDANTEWNRYLSISRIKEWQPELLTSLEKRNYWAVYYRPKKIQTGGDLWVFVDKNNGEIITTIQGD